MSRLILASTSRYRRELLNRLGLPFDTARPDTEESPLPGESPEAMATRLSTAKAEAVALLNPDAWAIGSDQVAEFDGGTLGKPGSREVAIAQLSAMAGRSVRFRTPLWVGPPRLSLFPAPSRRAEVDAREAGLEVVETESSDRGFSVRVAPQLLRSTLK